MIDFLKNLFIGKTLLPEYYDEPTDIFMYLFHLIYTGVIVWIIWSVAIAMWSV